VIPRGWPLPFECCSATPTDGRGLVWRPAPRRSSGSTTKTMAPACSNFTGHFSADEASSAEAPVGPAGVVGVGAVRGRHGKEYPIPVPASEPSNGFGERRGVSPPVEAGCATACPLWDKQCPSKIIIAPSQRQEHCFSEDSEAVAHLAFQRRRSRENDPQVTGIGRQPAGPLPDSVSENFEVPTGGLTARRSLGTGSRNSRVGFLLPSA